MQEMIGGSGTNTPSTELDVVGDIRLSGSSNLNHDNFKCCFYGITPASKLLITWVQVQLTLIYQQTHHIPRDLNQLNEAYLQGLESDIDDLEQN